MAKRTTTVQALTNKPLDCGHEPTQTNNQFAAGIASDADGRTCCYACAEARERAAFERAGDERTPFVAYMTGDPKVSSSLKIATWTGASLAEVISTRTIKLTRTSFTHGETILTYTARDSRGRLWYGRGNPGIVTILRRKGN